MYNLFVHLWPSIESERLAQNYWDRLWDKDIQCVRVNRYWWTRDKIWIGTFAELVSMEPYLLQPKRQIHHWIQCNELQPMCAMLYLDKNIHIRGRRLITLIYIYSNDVLWGIYDVFSWATHHHMYSVNMYFRFLSDWFVSSLAGFTKHAMGPEVKTA